MQGRKPSLLELCVHLLVSLLPDYAGLGENTLELPADILSFIIPRLSPLALHHVRLAHGRQHESVKRKFSELDLELDFQRAWRRFVSEHHPSSVQPVDVLPDWEQVYWEGHVQACLNFVVESLQHLRGHVGDAAMPDHMRSKIGHAGNLTLRTTLNYCHGFVHTLRIKGVLCVDELHVLLRNTHLTQIVFHNISSSSQCTNALRLVGTKQACLKRLSFCYSRFSNNDIHALFGVLKDVHNLESFTISCGAAENLTGLGKFLSCAAHLRTLQIKTVKVDFHSMLSAIVDLFSQTTSLLSSVRLSDLTGNCLKQALEQVVNKSSLKRGYLSFLQELDLQSCCLDAGSAVILFKYMKWLRHLKILNLSFNSFGDEGLELLVCCLQEHEISIQSLSLDGCNLTCKGITGLFNLPLPLTHLSIADNPLGSKCSSILARYIKDSKIQVLNIAEIGLGSVGCSEELASAVTSSESLLNLDISRNRIASAGTSFLCNIISSGQGALTRIAAQENLLNADSLKSLAIAMNSGKCKIKHLDLSFNFPDESVTEAFHQSFTSGEKPVVCLDSYGHCLHDDDP